MQVVTRDQNAKYGGKGNDQAVGTPEPAEGQELSLRHPSEIAVPEATRERELLDEVSALAQTLNFEEQVVHHRTHEVQVNAGIKVRRLMRDQNDKFHRTAADFEERARQVTEIEVAEARADVHRQAITAISDRERRIQEDSNRLVQLTHDLVAAQNAVEVEATQKALIIADAEEAIQRQRVQIIAEAEQTMQHQNQLISSRLADLQQEALSEKAAYDRERNFREHAQGELQCMNSQLLHEAGLYRTSTNEVTTMMQEIQSEQAEANIAKQRTTAAFQDGRLLHCQVEKLIAQVAQLSEDNKVAEQTIVQLRAQIPGDPSSEQQPLQQHLEQQATIAALTEEVEKLKGSNVMLSSRYTALEQRNALLESELNATKDSTSMILENGKEQSRKGT